MYPSTQFKKFSSANRLIELLVGLPMQKSKKGGEPRHYAISQLSERLKSKQLEILPETFDDPCVSRDKVVVTGTPPLCRFIYNDENPLSVKAEWYKIKYLK